MDSRAAIYLVPVTVGRSFQISALVCALGWRAYFRWWVIDDKLSLDILPLPGWSAKVHKAKGQYFAS